MKQKNNQSLTFPLWLVLFEVLVFLSTDAYLPALPQIAQDLHTTHALVGMTLTSWFLGSVLIQLFVGLWVDRFGRRPVMTMGTLLFFVSTASCAFAPNIHILLVARFFQGCCVPIVLVAGYSTIHDLFDQKKSIQILALLRAISVLAPAFGPLLGALILLFVSWHWIFGLLMVCGVIGGLGLYFKMPETLKPENKQPISFSSAFQVYKGIYSTPAFLKLSVISSLLFCMMIIWIASGPFIVMDLFHKTQLTYAVCQFLAFGSFIAATRLVTPLMNKMSLYKIVNYGVNITLLGGVASFVFSCFYAQFLSLFVLSMMIISAGFGMLSPVLNRLSIDSCEQYPMGMRVASYSAMQCIFSVFAASAVSCFYNETLLSIAWLMLICASLALGIRLFLKEIPSP